MSDCNQDLKIIDESCEKIAERVTSVDLECCEEIKSDNDENETHEIENKFETFNKLSDKALSDLAKLYDMPELIQL
ncbi:hypothetical protein BpHYR1_042660 [Brachionus plicatilis]|uniref:Uncharacterized protein n=1 Tax=Brachionus plicatilis TaxID=10195 RepID=A0A3M7QEI1_BRAPC|nr:hypothetical protein BpHYR1_042660 [Brachionus plicatilis]